jgi:hypothetical protein
MPKIVSASWPTGTRSGVAGSSIALAMANATTSGPGRPDGPAILVLAPSHCSQSPPLSAGPLCGSIGLMPVAMFPGSINTLRIPK